MNDIEQECIILNSVWKMIDGMVNWGMFVKHDQTTPTNMMFTASSNRTLFNILLGDFLSQLHAFKGEAIPLGLKAAPSNDLTFLLYLRQVCAKPHFALEAQALSACVESFATWLEGEFIAEGINLSDINVVANLRISRYRYIKICGDVAKHNLARLSANVRHIRTLMEFSGHPLTEHQAYLAVENFYEWFHNDIFIYYSSQIAEFLNNIRWAIFDYLRAEYTRSWHMTDKAAELFPIYAYRYPTGCNDLLARAMYWDVMNRVRAQPNVHRFVVSDTFKQRY